MEEAKKLNSSSVLQIVEGEEESEMNNKLTLENLRDVNYHAGWIIFSLFMTFFIKYYFMSIVTQNSTNNATYSIDWVGENGYTLCMVSLHAGHLIGSSILPFYKL